MHESPGRDARFFLALPDDPAAAGVAARIRARAEVLADHPSGRPWLLACLPARQVVVHDAGPNRLALLGYATATPTQLGRISDDARTIADLTGVSARFAGNYCVVGSLGGRVYAQGSAIGMRRVFHALVDGVRVVCDRADVLAELGALPLDEDALTLRLARSLPHPYLETPLWRGLNVVPPEDYVTVHGTRWDTGTWWRRPEPRLSRAEGARELRAALEAAVLARMSPGETVACDLSGGLDSTPLCYFAANGTGDVVAKTGYNEDPGGREDLDWARRALPVMPGVREHVVQSTDDMPAFFGGLTGMYDRLDEPTQSMMAGPRLSGALADSAAGGITVHLNGLGGDHLLCGFNGWEHSLFRTRPLLAWRRARGVHIPDGHRLRVTLRELLDRASYRDWLREAVGKAVRNDRGAGVPRISDWSLQPSLPPWLSPSSRDALTRTLYDLAGSANPLGPDRAAHLELFVLRDGGRVIRGAAQLGARAGVAYEAPLLDDHVAEAALAVRREERVTPVEWKPLMKAAMRGLLPEDFLRRNTKVGGSPQAVRGFAAHHREIHALCAEAGLFGADPSHTGRLDQAAFAEATRPDPKSMPNPHVNETINLALFLRNQARSADATHQHAAERR